MKRGLQWPIAVAVILGLTILGNIYVAVRANDDPSFSVDSDYYQKAVRFDAEQALRRRGERLGWRLRLDAASAGAAGATVTAHVDDSTGTPVRGARVRFTARHVARGNAPVNATAQESGGAYVATLPMHRRGLWDVDVEVVRGNDRLVAEQRLDLPTLH